MSLRLRMMLGRMAIILVVNAALYFLTVYEIHRIFFKVLPSDVLKNDLSRIESVYRESFLETSDFLKSYISDANAKSAEQVFKGLVKSKIFNDVVVLGADGRVVLSTESDFLSKLLRDLKDRCKEVYGVAKVRGDSIGRIWCREVMFPAGSYIIVGIKYSSIPAFLNSITKVLYSDFKKCKKGTSRVFLFFRDGSVFSLCRNNSHISLIKSINFSAIHGEPSKVLKAEHALIGLSTLRNISGDVEGFLGLILSENLPWAVAMERSMVKVFGAVLIFTTMLMLVLLYLHGRWVLGPIDRILCMSKRIMNGDMSARIGTCPSGEMGILCRAIDQMVEALQEREHRLKQAMNRQISQSDKLASIGRLAAGVAHEINNPLTGVLTFAHLLQKSDRLGEEEKKDVEVIINETTRVREIVKRLLEFARETPQDREPLDVNHIMSQVIFLLRNQKEFRKVDIEENYDKRLPKVIGDKNQLQQVFLNLALNACEAMPEGGKLTISTQLKDGHVVISFRDTGVGIPEEYMNKLFDPFFTTKPVGQGTGLGLSVSYGIVKQHGGRIEVESKVGEGSTFSVWLPVESS